jgi:mycofactocin precursor
LTGGAAGAPRDRLAPELEEAVMLSEDQEVRDAEELADDEIDELLVEEVSIDGMCGVY